MLSGLHIALAPACAEPESDLKAHGKSVRPQDFIGSVRWVSQPQLHFAVRPFKFSRCLTGGGACQAKVALPRDNKATQPITEQSGISLHSLLDKKPSLEILTPSCDVYHRNDAKTIYLIAVSILEPEQYLWTVQPFFLLGFVGPISERMVITAAAQGPSCNCMRPATACRMP